MHRAVLMALLLAWPIAGRADPLVGHGGPVMDITISPDTGQIATASFDNAVGLWSGPDAHWLDGHEAAVNTVIFLADGTLASAGDDFSVRIWDDPVRVLTGHSAKVTALEQSGDGALLASASWDGTIGLWRGDAPPVWLRGHDSGVNDLAFADDGRTLYSGSSDGTIRAWDVSGTFQDRLIVRHGFGINRLVLNDTDGWLAYGAVDGGTRVIDTDSGAVLADLTAGRRPILAMARDADGRRLAIGDGEGFIMVLDTPQWRILHDFRATARGPVWALALTPDGQTVYAGGIAPEVKVFSMAGPAPDVAQTDATPSFLRDPATMTNGERQFARKCSVCHTLDAGSARRAGPSLHGLFGRRAGVVDDYAYSDVLTASDIVWSDQTINALFDQGPDHYIPGTKMPMQRIVARKDRDDLIAFLRRATDPKE